MTLIAYIKGMSAAEIIEQIKRLPPEEKQAVREFIRSEEGGADGGVVQYVERKELERTAKEIFKEHEQLFRKLAQ